MKDANDLFAATFIFIAAAIALIVIFYMAKIVIPLLLSAGVIYLILMLIKENRDKP